MPKNLCPSSETKDSSSEYFPQDFWENFTGLKDRAESLINKYSPKPEKESYFEFKSRSRETIKKAGKRDRKRLRRYANELDSMLWGAYLNNHGLCFHIAKIVKNSGIDSLNLEEIAELGEEGLINSIFRYDPERGFQFSTYAGRCIESSIHRSISLSHYKIPVRIKSNIKRVRKEINNGNGTDIETLGKETGLTETEIAEALRIINTKFVREGTGLYSEKSFEIPSISRHQEYSDTHADVATMLNSLSERERNILCLRFGIEEPNNRNGIRSLNLDELMEKLGVDNKRAEQIQQGSDMRLHELGRLYNLTRERIRQIEKETLAFLNLRFIKEIC